ncbi:hypothetical protein [Hyphobacterium sp.]|uniref:hypothetical protein n=1 Tax=Hyphobacterium sp. TaxID=2004662 RepID=UPI00374A4038
MIKVLTNYFLVTAASLLAAGLGVYLAVGREQFWTGMVWSLLFFPLLCLLMFSGDFWRAVRNSKNVQDDKNRSVR